MIRCWSLGLEIPALVHIFNRWPVTWMNISSNQYFAVLDYITGTSNYRSLCQEEEIAWLPSTFVPSVMRPHLVSGHSCWLTFWVTAQVVCVLKLCWSYFLHFLVCISIFGSTPLIIQKAKGNKGMMRKFWKGTLIFLGMIKTSQWGFALLASCPRNMFHKYQVGVTEKVFHSSETSNFIFNTTLSMIIGASDVSVWSKADQSKTPYVLFSDQRPTIPSGKNIIIREGGITMWRCCVVDRK